MRRIFFVIVCVLAVISCTEHNDYRKALTHAEDIIDEYPDSSIVILDTLAKHDVEFSKQFKMEILLYKTYAKAKTGILFTTDSLTKIIVKYYDKEGGNSTEKALSCYLNGCALSDIGDAPEALQTFYDAIDKTDTIRNKRDLLVLKGIYGQMSQIFHQQNLPHDEIWALKRYIECVRKTSSEEDFILAKGQMIRPYYLLGEKDSVLQMINDKYHSLKRLGNNSKAASALSTAVYIYTERGQIREAKQCVDIFEHESALFDNKGNISPGREGYYFTKGFFELALDNLEKAEFYFRKAIRYGYLSEGYKGLLSVYRRKNMADSVFQFSKLYEAAQDSLHNKMQTEAIHQMSALYNYSRSQKEAETERENSRRARLLTAFITVTAIIIIGLLGMKYWKKEKKRMQKIAALELELKSTKTARIEIIEELQQLKQQDYENVIAAKENKLVNLTKTIEQLQAENEKYKEISNIKLTNNLDQFLNSKIATLFIKKATDNSEKVQPTEAEWKMLISEFSKNNPVTYKSFGSGKALSKLEQRICILLILGIPEYIIVIMTNSSASTISNLKARANEKLFGKKDAHPLKINLIHSLKTS